MRRAFRATRGGWRIWGARVLTKMGLPRRWTCTFTKDTHKKPRNARWEDGIFDVDVDGGCSARLYRADDDGKPVGESLARRCLTKSEMTALEEGDPINEFEGHNIQPDEEQGGESSAPPAAAAPAGAAATRPLARPRGAPSTRYVNPLAAPAVRRPFRAPAMAAPRPRPTPDDDAPPPKTQRVNAPTSRTAAAAVAAADDDDMDDEAANRILEALVRRDGGGGGGGFADLYAESRGERPGNASARASAGDAPAVPLAKRRSKWEAYAAPAAARPAGGDSDVREATKTTTTTTAAAGAGGGFGDVAAALRAAGGGGLGGLATLGKLASAPSSAPPLGVFRAPARSRDVAPPTRPTPSGKPPASDELRLEFLSRDALARRRKEAPPAPSSFASAEAYRAYFCELVRVDLLSRLAGVRAEVEKAATRVATSAGPGLAPARVTGRGDGGVDPVALRGDLRGRRGETVDYYADCTLRFESFRAAFSTQRKKKAGGGNPRRGAKGRWGARGGDGEDDDADENEDEDEDEDVAANEPTNKTWLHLNDANERRGSKEYGKGDLWVISSVPRLVPPPLGEVGDRARAPWTVVAQSLWHGPDKDGKLEVRLLTPRPAHGMRGDRFRAYAVKAFNAQTSLAEFDNFANATEASFPLLPHVLGAPLVDESSSENALAADAAALRDRHGLNEDQSDAVARALVAATEAGTASPVAALTVNPVRLVHGPFGSGKTHALAAFVVSAAERLAAAKSNARILISAHTNVAVDRLLSALLARGFTEFVRVGALRRIDYEILPYSLHVAASGGKRKGGEGGDEPVMGAGGRALRGKGADHARELRAMLRDATTARERAVLQRELASAQAGTADARARALSKCRVVGVTTASCGNDAMKDFTFAVAILDECSQMTEPSSMLAMSRFGCRALVAVGDPKQLPPVLESKSDDRENPLARGLFVRLADAGHRPALLRTQYRLHPTLAAVPNRCFYDGRLVDGCSAEDRAPLLRVDEREHPEGGVVATPMPPMTWLDVASGGETYEGRSMYSPKEARAAAAMAARALELGIAPGDVGVITLYRAQARAVARELGVATDVAPATTARNGDGDENACDGENAKDPEAPVQVSTVDSFQGQEKEIIILSLCGSGGSGGGSGGSGGAFATDERVNVALTRAKRHLVVIGDSRHPSIRAHRAWSACLAAARRSPGGFVEAQSVATEGLLRAKLAKWRRAPEPERVTVASDSSDDDLDDDDDDRLHRRARAKPRVGAPARSVDDADAEAEVEVVDVTESGAWGALGGQSSSSRGWGESGSEPKSDGWGGDGDGWGGDGGGWGGGDGDGGDDVVERDVERVVERVVERAAATNRDGDGVEDLTTPARLIDDDAKAATTGGVSAVDLAWEEEERADAAAARGDGASPVAVAYASQPSPEMDWDALPASRLAVHEAFAAPDVNLSPEAYWRAYSDIHRGCLYGVADARRRVEASPVGRALERLFDLGPAPWDGWDTSKLRRSMFREALPGMFTYVHATHGWRWTRLRRLIEAFDDPLELALEVGGFGGHVVHDAETQDAEEAQAEAFADAGDPRKAGMD